MRGAAYKNLHIVGWLTIFKYRPFDCLFCIMILPANYWNLPPDVSKSPPQVIVGIEQGLAPLVDQVNVSKLMEF